jgi:hypothetical protein
LLSISYFLLVAVEAELNLALVAAEADFFFFKFEVRAVSEIASVAEILSAIRANLLISLVADSLAAITSYSETDFAMKRTLLTTLSRTNLALLSTVNAKVCSLALLAALC